MIDVSFADHIAPALIVAAIAYIVFVCAQVAVRAFPQASRKQ